MNSREIESLLLSDKFAAGYLIGVFAADQIPSKVFPGAYIVNTDDWSEPGQHWVAFFLVDGEIECFDSFGENPAKYSNHIEKWIENDYKIVQCETLQSRDSTVCGQYCMYFVLLRSYGFTYKDIMSSLTRKKATQCCPGLFDSSVFTI